MDVQEGHMLKKIIMLLVATHVVARNGGGTWCPEKIRPKTICPEAMRTKTIRPGDNVPRRQCALAV